MSVELMKEIQDRKCGLAIKELIDGTLDELTALGLTWLTICEYGSKRSCDSAKNAAFNHKIPSMYLIGGFQGLLKYLTKPDLLKQYIARLTTGKPSLAIILTKEQFPYYQEKLPKLTNYTLFYSEDHFFDQIT